MKSRAWDFQFFFFSMPCEESDLSSSPWYVNTIGDNVCGTLTEDTLVTSEQSLRVKGDHFGERK